MKVQGRRKRGRPNRRWLDRAVSKTVGEGRVRVCYMEEYVIVHRSHIKVRKDAVPGD